MSFENSDASKDQNSHSISGNGTNGSNGNSFCTSGASPTTPFQWAKYYKDTLGFSVFAVKGKSGQDYSDSKVPAAVVGPTSPFFYRQPTDQELQTWFSDPRLGVAIVGGAISKVIFIDDDRPKHGLVRKPFEPITVMATGQVLNIPPTACARTAGGGFSYWFRVSDEQIAGLGDFAQDTSKFVEKVDIKFNHQYVVSPSTMMVDNRSYSFLPGHTPGVEMAIAELPDDIYRAILKYLESKKTIGSNLGVSSNQPGWIAEEFKLYGPNNRNSFINRLAGVYAQAGIDDHELVVDSILALVGDLGEDDSHHRNTIIRTVSNYLNNVNKRNPIKKKLVFLRRLLLRGGLSLEKVEKMLVSFLQFYELEIEDLSSKNQDEKKQLAPSPAELADVLRNENQYIATPIGDDGRGQVLYLYTGGVFHPCGADLARRRLLELLGKDATDAKIDTALKILKEKVKVDYSRINAKALELINVKNGMLDWKTGELLSHDPAFLSTFQLNVSYNPAATSIVLENFLAEVLPPDSLNLSDQLIGYLLIPTTMFQRAFLLYGTGSNGKSTYLSMLHNFLGSENTSATPLQELSERFKAATIEGKLANICNDLPASVMKDASNFKMMVSGEPIVAERKHMSPYKFHPYARLLFSANHKPASYDTSDGFFRRWVIIPFANRFAAAKNNSKTTQPEKIADKKLPQKLAAEEVKSALLNRALMGLRKLMEQQSFDTPESCEKELESYRQDVDQVRAFLTEITVEDVNSVIGKGDLYEEYKKWAVDEGLKPMTARRFSKKVSEILKISEVKADPNHDGRRKMCWNGLRLIVSDVKVSSTSTTSQAETY